MNTNNIANHTCKKVAVYTRVSSREQALYGISLEAQKEKIIAYLKIFDKDISNVIFYTDEGKSAKDLNREGLRNLLLAIERNEIEEVYIQKLDRLSRSVIDVYDLINKFLKYDVNLVAITDNINIQTANGRFLIGVLSIIAQWEREQIAERTNDSLLALAMLGKFPLPKIPFGWMKNEEGYLLLHPEESKVRKQLYFDIINGYSCKEIEDRLIGTAYPLKSEQIKSYVTDERSIGKMIYKDQEFNNIIPAIIDEENFYKAQHRIKQREKKYPSFAYLFGNKIECCLEGKVCERSSTVKKNKIYYYYVSPTSGKRINQEKLLEEILYQVLNKSKKIKLTKEMSVALNKIEQLEKKMESLLDKYMRNVITERMYLLSIFELDHEREKSLKRIKLMDKKIGVQDFNKMTNEDRYNFINAYIEKIVYDFDTKKVMSVSYKS